MKHEIVTFDGGVNNLIAPHLIPENTSPYVSNSLIVSGELVSAKEPRITDIPYNGKHTIYYKAEDEIVSSEEDRFYVEWAGFLYWSNFVGDGSGKIQRYDGTNVLDIGGHVPPVTAPSATTDGAGLLAGDYYYCYTYVYDEVFESAPSDIDAILTVANNKVKITFSDTLPSSPAPTHRILYRSGGFNPTFNQVEVIPIGTPEYIDNTSDFTISRKELTTGTNDAPPADIDMLVESGGTLFGAVKNRVHFSKEGQPEYWSAYNYVELPTAVTGLGVIGGSIIAFTEENMFAITGRSVKDIALTKLPFQFGCSNKRTVRNLKGRLIWLTASDEYQLLCSFDGAGVEVLNRMDVLVVSTTIGNHAYDMFTTETYQDVDLTIQGALAIGRKYFLFLNGRTVVLDFDNNFVLYYMTERVLSAFEYHNKLIVVKKDPDSGQNKNYQYLPSNAYHRDIAYTTRDFSGGTLTSNKNYRKVNVNADGDWGIMVMVDNKHVFSFDYVNGQTVLLPAGTVGKTISFKIASNGFAKIKSIEYEYDMNEDGFRQVIKPYPHLDLCGNSVGDEDARSYHVAFPWKPECHIFKI